MSDATVVRLRGEGGVEWDFELPLNEVYADQVKSHKLTPVDDDSAAALADLFAELAAGEPAADGTEGELTLEQRIDAVNGHDAANTLAAELGVEGFTAKKPSVADKKDALKAKAAELAAGEPAADGTEGE